MFDAGGVMFGTRLDNERAVCVKIGPDPVLIDAFGTFADGPLPAMSAWLNRGWAHAVL
jgi:hypothetical protein